eukprot:2134346-Rhodomonas_salina.1
MSCSLHFLSRVRFKIFLSQHGLLTHSNSSSRRYGSDSISCSSLSVLDAYTSGITATSEV